MDTAAAAQTAGVTIATIRHWARCGAVAAAKQAGRWVISRASLLRRIAIGAIQRRIRRTITTPATAPAPTPERNPFMSDITIETAGNHAYLVAPYSPAANDDYKATGGRWDRDRRAWRFDVRDIEKVRAVVREHFGYDDQATEGVDVRVTLSGTYGRGAECRYFGRVLAERTERDRPVRLGRDVVLAEGRFERSAGSVKSPAVGDVDGIVLEVRNVPAGHADLELDEVEVIETGGVDRDALQAERAKLEARLAEIRTLLGE